MIIYIISDSLGNTAKEVIRAALAQFEGQAVTYSVLRYPFINSPSELDGIYQQMPDSQCLVIQTLVNPELAAYSRQLAEEKGVQLFDILTDMIASLAAHFELAPKSQPGLLRKVDQAYFNRIHAIEFTVKYDDGKDVRGLSEADVVLIGVSRTSKTPLSMYLANQQLKVMNLPLILGSPIPQELFQLDRRKIFGLTTSLDHLNRIREERLKSLGMYQDNTYTNQEQILEELNYAHSIMNRLGCPIIDIENKAIEETAELIMERMKQSGLTVVNL